MATERLKCEQCGREGTRGFKLVPSAETPWGPSPAFTVCAALKACRRRWPKQAVADD